jgi:thiamine biosynthesis lipoprotein
MPSERWTTLTKKARQRIDAFDKVYSRFRTDSLVTAMSRKAGRYTMPDDGYRLLRLYARLYSATDGAITPLIGNVISDAGYDAGYSLRAKRVTRPPAWEDVLEYTPDHIELRKPVLLDFGCAGKGYLVDIVARLMRDAGLQSFTIDAGGDMLHRGQAIDVGLENPLNTSEVIGSLSLGDQSLCASSGSRRQWDGYHHIISPQTLHSPEHVLSTWVIADDTATADGLATALFFVEPARLREQFDFSYAILRSDMSLERDKSFPAQLYEADPA